MGSAPQDNLDSFPNPNAERDYTIRFDCPEFTCLCPLTGQPDFARFKIEYTPDKLCVELKSLKLYLWSYRNKGAFHEAVTNQVANDVIRTVDPRRLKVEAEWFVRGGIGTTVLVEHVRKA